MKTVFIKNVLLNGTKTNIRISGNLFSDIDPLLIPTEKDEIIEADNFAIVPPFYNAHTHAAMSLLRGYADDMALFPWLNDYIWPFEAKMTADDIYIGTRLAILEMIKSGTVFYNDMYWMMDSVWKATDEMGIRACLGVSFMDFLGEEKIQKSFDLVEEYLHKSSMIQMSVAPHAPYTVSDKLWIRCADFAKQHHTIMHFHLSETEKEVKDCVAEHGMTPVRWLDSLGVLGSNCIAAHVVHVDEEEIQILKKRDVAIAHNPVSNMKLSSGFFKSALMEQSSSNVLIGTDGCSSNNNLDMIEESKFAAMIAKCNYGPETLPVNTVIDWSVKNGPKVFGLNGGEIAVGKLADALLINMDNERFVPNFNFNSNWIYASSCEAIDTMICNGKIVMRHRHVNGEEEIISSAKQCAKKWM
jgi:5-methylthioadenosine/S-adenosylhomocysteine deaminase